jgi:phosphohistidine phosphatase
MKRKLYFLRHAVALEREDWHNKDDELRPLIKQGITETQRLAKHLTKLGFRAERIITSPLVRAYDTGKIVADTLGVELLVDDHLKPGCDRVALKTILEKYDFENLILVGHEPDFSDMITDIIDGGRIKMKKGALAFVELEDSKKLRGTLRWLLTPDLLTT